MHTVEIIVALALSSSITTKASSIRGEEHSEPVVKYKSLTLQREGTGSESFPQLVETVNNISLGASLHLDRDKKRVIPSNTSKRADNRTVQPETNSNYDGSGNYSHYVGIVVPNQDILIGKDPLEISCKPLTAFIDIIKYKIVHDPKIGNTTDECEWTYHLQNKTIVPSCIKDRIKVQWTPPLPLGNATLHIKIDKNDISLYDSGNYSCKIQAATADESVEGESSLKAVEVMVNPNPPVPDENHMNIGMIVGIGVGCVFVVAIVVPVVRVLWKRRRDSQPDNNEKKVRMNVEDNM